MKNHGIIPIFIPHLGCNNECVFCNQNIITARTKVPTEEDIRYVITRNLKTMESTLETIEVAFYGGSFTGIPTLLQEKYLKIAKEFKDSGQIQKIHMSTRPDYIDKSIIGILKKYSVDIVELGVQSFDDEVLKASQRGHTSDDVYRAAELIKKAGIELGIQLMVGLPKDTKRKAVESAKKTVKLTPSLARIYPTIVFPDTRLANMVKEGTYSPLSQEEAIEISKEVYKILYDANITIMRVGLKSTDLVKTGNELGGDYHPAFRQLVEGEIALEKLVESIKMLDAKNMKEIFILTNSRWTSAFVGHGGANKKFLVEKLGAKKIHFLKDETIGDFDFKIEIN